jgi:hypothetical protein
MKVNKNIIVNASFMYERHRISIGEILKQYYEHIKGYENNNYIVQINDISLETKSYDILEIFDSIYNEFAQLIKEENMSDNTIKNIDSIYEKHRKIIQDLQSESQI